MLKTRVVLDAGIIVSFLLSQEETVSSIFDSWEKQKIDLLISENIFEEIGALLKYKKIRKLINPWEKAALLEKLKLQAGFVKVKTKDNKYLECAVNGWADFIVSENKQLLDLKEHKGIRVLTPQKFVSTHDRKNKNTLGKGVWDR